MLGMKKPIPEPQPEAEEDAIPVNFLDATSNAWEQALLRAQLAINPFKAAIEPVKTLGWKGQTPPDAEGELNDFLRPRFGATREELIEKHGVDAYLHTVELLFLREQRRSHGFQLLARRYEKAAHFYRRLGQTMMDDVVDLAKVIGTEVGRGHRFINDISAIAKRMSGHQVLTDIGWVKPVGENLEKGYKNGESLAPEHRIAQD